MKIFQNIVIILILVAQPAFKGLAQQDIDNSALWKGSTAYTIPKGEVECGLFQPLRLGLSASVEISAHPILFFFDPGVGLKIRLHQNDNLMISSVHNLSIPTPLLRFFQIKGAGGLISSQYKIPTLLSLYNGILISGIFNNKSLLTTEAGFYLSAGTSRLDKTSSIDLPIIYPRLGSLYHQPEFLFGLNFNSIITKHFNYLLMAETYVTPFSAENLFFEHSGIIQWKPGTHFMVQAGYKLCYGRYAFGSLWTLLPNLDLVFHFGRQKGEG